MQALTVGAQPMTFRLTLLLALAWVASARADDSFIKALSPADFQAAGLGKLTPDELAKLDLLVRSRQTGAVAKATAETTQSVSLSVRAQVQAEEQKKQSSGILEKMKVILKPGTEIEYSSLDSVLVNVTALRNGKDGTVFTLANGQRWFTAEDDYWLPSGGGTIHVRVIPGSMGSFFMDIERGGRPRVKFIGTVAPSPASP
jgi:hypothetical protein